MFAFMLGFKRDQHNAVALVLNLQLGLVALVLGAPLQGLHVSLLGKVVILPRCYHHTFLSFLLYGVPSSLHTPNQTKVMRVS